MTQLEIMRYAYHGLLDIWGREYDRYQEHPENEFTRARFEKYDNELNELRDLLMEEEQKERI